MNNVGTPDRIFRLILGALLVIAPFVTPLALWADGWTVWVSVIIGGILAATAVFGFCPIYAALRLSTKRHSRGIEK